MGKKAIDVVLLPDQTMTDKAIEANSKLAKKFGKKILLNTKDCLPHISLAMGCIDEDDIAPIDKILQTIAKECLLGDLTVLGVHSSGNSASEKVSVFEVEKTEELQQLHKTVMEQLSPYLSCNVTGDMVCAEGEVEESTLLWIKNYREKSSFDKFFPHITIGYGELSELPSFPIKFVASKLALCHLGNHCTCRKILASVKLENEVT